MPVQLYDHQKLAINKLKNGSILCGGVGSGKSRTAIAYYLTKDCGGKIDSDNEIVPMTNPKDLYIITTARKRDTFEWEKECIPFVLSSDPNLSVNGVKVKVDSWNNIGKYVNVKNAFFIFDEQRLVGSGEWVKSFLKITPHNNWILLSATPGDTWMDYVPVFIANGFYKNRTEFIRRHVIYSRFAKFPKIDRYVECNRLIKLRHEVIVYMHYIKPTTPHDENIIVPFNKELTDTALIQRWHVFEERPIKDISELCFLLRRISNTDPSRAEAIKQLSRKHPKLIIFYNFNYELDILRKLGDDLKIPTAEWNGHKHELIPKTDKWLYLVQYTAGAEGWNCIETNAIVFYSQNYSYKIMTQAAGRIDRLNTSFTDLYYYHIRSKSAIDDAIAKAIKHKKNFNEQQFVMS